MSTHNIRFHQEIRQILCGYPLLSVAMLELQLQQEPSLHYPMAPDKREYPCNSFFISPLKQILWVLIRSTSMPCF